MQEEAMEAEGPVALRHEPHLWWHGLAPLGSRLLDWERGTMLDGRWSCGHEPQGEA